MSSSYHHPKPMDSFQIVPIQKHLLTKCRHHNQCRHHKLLKWNIYIIKYLIKSKKNTIIMRRSGIRPIKQKLYKPLPVFPWTRRYDVPFGKSFKTFNKSSNEVGIYQVPLVVLIWPTPLDLEHWPDPWHFTMSSMSGVSKSVLAKDLKASKIGLYPVHLQMFPSKTFSISPTVVFFPEFCWSRLGKYVKKMKIYVLKFISR